MKYRPDIDGLRALAVLPVVFYHAGVPSISGGFIGVDVFFVISGFLITSIVAREIAEGRFSLISFYERRARRILPALTVVILASFAVSWFVLLPAEMEQLGQSAIATSLFFSNLYFLSTLDYFSQAAEFAPLLHTWSLAVEEQFYLFFPPLLMLLAWMGLTRSFLAVAGLSLVSLVAAIATLPSHPESVFYQIFFRAWELGAGAMLALAAVRPPRQRAWREVIAVAGLAAIIIPIFTFDAATPFPAAAALPPVVGATILIWVGAQGGGSIVSSVLGYRFLVWIGLISYSLYLWHWPILAFARILLDSAVLPMHVGIGAVILSTLMAWGSLHFVERRFRVPAPQGFGRRTIFLVSACSLTFIGVAGALMDVTKGLPARLPTNVTRIAEFAGDTNDRRKECFNRRPNEGLCSIGTLSSKDSTIDFLFWGDSHANAMMPGMDEAASIAGKRGVFAGHSGCPPFIAVQKVRGGKRCTSFNESILSWLRGREDVELVILGARWPLFVEGTRYRGEAGTDLYLESIDGSLPSSNISNNTALIRYGLIETLTEIVASGRKVLLLGPTPEIGHDVPKVLARKELFQWAPVPTLTRADYDARAGRAELILQQVAERIDAVTYLPLSPSFCDAEKCHVKSAGGSLFYSDNNHITQTAALTLLTPSFRKIWP